MHLLDIYEGEYKYLRLQYTLSNSFPKWPYGPTLSAGCEGSCCLKPLPNICVAAPLILAILIRMWFNLHFLTTTEVEHLFTQKLG